MKKTAKYLTINPKNINIKSLKHENLISIFLKL